MARNTIKTIKFFQRRARVMTARRRKLFESLIGNRLSFYRSPALESKRQMELCSIADSSICWICFLFGSRQLQKVAVGASWGGLHFNVKANEKILISNLTKFISSEIQISLQTQIFSTSSKLPSLTSRFKNPPSSLAWLSLLRVPETSLNIHPKQKSIRNFFLSAAERKKEPNFP